MKELAQIDAWLAPGEQLRTWFDPVFRVATSLIFVVGGIGHFAAHDYMLQRMAESPWRNVVNMIGDPSWLLWLSGAAFVTFGITLALGFLTRISALLLLVTLVPVTIAVHVAPGHMGPFLKNVAIMGALLYFYANGPGRFAIDRSAPLSARARLL